MTIKDEKEEIPGTEQEGGVHREGDQLDISFFF